MCAIDQKLGTNFNEHILAPVGLDRMTREQLVDQYRIKRRIARRAGLTCANDFRQMKGTTDDCVGF